MKKLLILPLLSMLTNLAFADYSEIRCATGLFDRDQQNFYIRLFVDEYPSGRAVLSYYDPETRRVSRLAEYEIIHSMDPTHIYRANGHLLPNLGGFLNFDFRLDWSNLEYVEANMKADLPNGKVVSQTFYRCSVINR